MESLMLLLFVLMEIVAIVDVLRTVLPPSKKMLWVIFIIIVPVAGIFLYFLMGKPDQQVGA